MAETSNHNELFNSNMNASAVKHEIKDDATEHMLNFISVKQYIDPENPKLGYGNYAVNKSKIINILLVGRSQTGKSTLLETLINPQQAVQGRGFSVTKDPQVQAFTFYDQEEKSIHTVNVIDTPGLQEKRIDDLKSRDDEEIMRLARECILKQIAYLNIVIYVSVAGRTHELDTDAFDNIKKFLGDEFSENSLLILTHCEALHKKRFQRILADMESYPKTAELLHYCKLGVLPYGTMNADFIVLGDEDDDDEDPAESEANKYKKVNKVLQKVEKMRADLFKIIIKSVDMPRPVTQLEACLQYINSEQQRVINDTLGFKKDEWDKKFDEQLKLYNEQFKIMQETDYERYEASLIAERNRLREKHQNDLAKQAEFLKNVYEQQFEDEQKKLREEYEKLWANLTEKEQREKVRQQTKHQEKEAKARQKRLQLLTDQKRLEEEKQAFEQERRETEERHNREKAEMLAERARSLDELQKRLRAEFEAKQNHLQCIVM